MTEDLRDRLETLRAARGFLLPHHGALAAGAPRLHDAYLKMYTALTVESRELSPFARECVWLALLVVAREGIGTHHIELFLKHGGTPEQAEALIAMAGFCTGFDALIFASEAWSRQLPGLDAAQAYTDGLSALNAGRLPDELSELSMLCAQAALGSHAGVTHHLARAYALGISEPRMLEALSYVIWPVGVNRLVEACTAWHELLKSGAVTPSDPFRIWAEFPGLTAFDPDGENAVGDFDTGND